MMDWWMIILSVIAIIGVAICIYTVNNTNRKLNRLRRRYDYLLRGRGDLNLEELIVRYGEELDGEKSLIRGLSDQLKALEPRLSKAEAQQSGDIQQELLRTSNAFRIRLDELESNFNLSMKRLDEAVYARMAEVEGNTTQSLSKAIGEINHDLEQFSTTLNSQLSRFEEETYTRFDHVAQELDAREQGLRQSLSATDTALKLSISMTDQSLNDRLSGELAAVNSRLALTIQKYYLHRYNAFEDLSSEQSFTVALLDANNTGLLLTSIYSRQGSSTFSKWVEKGLPRQGVSPEEQYALDQAINQ